MALVKLTREHVLALNLRSAQRKDMEYLNDEYLDMVENHSESYTGLCDGVPVFCYGLTPVWEGRAIAWALIGEDIKKHAKELHETAKYILGNSVYRRIEATIDPTFKTSIRWIERLGFKYECTFKSYSPSGEDMLSYVRLK